MAFLLYSMRSKLTVQYVILCCTGVFMVLLVFQIWDLRREFKTYVSVNPCIQLLQSSNLKLYKLSGCGNTQDVQHSADGEKVHTGKPEALSIPSKPRKIVLEGINESEDLMRKSAVIQRKVCPNKLQVLILISSHYSHIVRRTSIRSTWGVDGSILLRWSTIFVLAQGKNATKMMRAVAEQKIYRDIIIGNFEEGFYKLTGKVEYGLHWSLRYCQFDYLLKGDDDVFVNVPKLISFVQLESTPQKRLYSGNVHYRAIVERSGRYGVPKEDYSKSIYPRYCSGGGFVLSVDVVSDIVEKLLLFPGRRRLIIDDAYVGELALEAGVDVYPSEDFLMFETSCTFKPNAIVFHPVKDIGCMRKLYITSTTPTESYKAVTTSTTVVAALKPASR